MRLVRSLRILWVGLRYGLFSRQPRAQRLRLALEALGPIFVKLGQVLSTRADLLAEDFAQELAKLQDRVPPFAGERAIAIVEASLKRPLDAVFSEFQREAGASASIAQVHFARLASNGAEVAVKVLRPGMRRSIKKDLALMHTLAWWAEKLSADGRRLKPRAVVQEFDNHLHDELDLLREAANAAQLKRNMQDVPQVRIPEIYWDYCGPEVMVMQRMYGSPINQVDAMRQAGIDLAQLARDGVTIFYTQVFRDGFFHADMHPGNILVGMDGADKGKYLSLDFGIVGTLSGKDKSYLAQNFAAFFNRDYRRVAELHIESGWVSKEARVDALEAAVRGVCEPYFNRPLKDISMGLILLRLFQVSRRFDVQIQPQLVLLQKTLLNIEGLGRKLDPDLDLWSTAKPFLENWMKNQFGPQALLRELRAHAPQYLEMAPQMPILLRKFLEQGGQGDPHTAALNLHLQEEIKALKSSLRWQGWVLLLLAMLALPSLFAALAFLSAF